METKTVIRTKKLTKIYNTEVAVDSLSFGVDRGEIFGFLGPNGAGKTTTLLMLLGLTEPSSGKARVMNIEPTSNPIGVKRNVGYLPENMGFYRDLDARQMLQFVAELNSLPRTVSKHRIEKALEDVGLHEEGKKTIGAYSRGMRQRLGIAELLVKDAQIAFLDEPTLGLDPDATNRMIDLIKKCADEREWTIILCSHFLHQIQKVCDRIGIMIKGRMVAQGPMDHLAEEKLGVGRGEYTLEEIYMKYFRET